MHDFFHSDSYKDDIKSYASGSVLRLRMRNFLTYDDCTVYPGAHLNLVLGANGTGKSSIVAALCLALCGRVELLKQAEKIYSYVKTGKEYAELDIDLKGFNEEIYTISRRIDLKFDSSRVVIGQQTKWKLMGRVASEKDVMHTVNSLRIRLDSIVQFLPQHRVGDFAGYSPTQILQESERALDDDASDRSFSADGTTPASGDTLLSTKAMEAMKEEDILKLGLRETRRQLSCLVDRSLSSRKDITSTEEKLKQLKDVQALYEGRLANHRQRQQLEEQLQMLRKKICWLEYYEGKKRQKEAGNAVKEAQLQLQEEHSKLEPLKASLYEKERAVERLKVQRDQVEREGNAAMLSIDDAEDRIKEAQLRLRKLHQQKNSVSAKEKQLEHNVELKRTALQKESETRDSLERLLAKFNDVRRAEISRQAQQASQKVSSLRQQQKLLQQERVTLTDDLSQVEKQLRSASDDRSHILQALLQDYRTGRTVSAMERLRDRDGTIGGIPVEGPLLACIQRIRHPDKRAVAAIEYRIPPNVQSSYCVSHENHGRLAAYLRENMDRRCMATLHTPMVDENTPKGHPSFPILQSIPGIAWLDDCIEASPSVYSVLRSAGLGTTLFVPDMQGQAPEPILASLPMQNVSLVEPYGSVKKITSRFSSNCSFEARQTVLKDADKLRCLVNGDSLSHDAQQKLKLERENLQSRLAKLDEELQELVQPLQEAERLLSQCQKQLAEAIAHRKEWEHARRKCERAQEAVSSAEAALEGFLSNEGNVSSLMERIQLTLRQLVQGMLIHAEKLRNLQRVRFEADVPLVQLGVALDEKEAVQRVLDEQEANLRSLKAKLSAAKVVEQEQIKKVEKLKQVAQHACPLTPEIEAVFATLPATLSVCVGEQTEMEAAIRALHPLAQSILDEYERRAVSISQLEQQLMMGRQVSESLAQLEGRWKSAYLSVMQEHVSRISESFSAHFLAVGAAGSVILDTSAARPAEWGIVIQVRFRQPADHEVSSGVTQLHGGLHSGGEKAVSTMLYLISLQDSNSRGFRVVDEINQGMDVRFERKVIARVSLSSCRESAPQTFMISPKLLPDLDYHPWTTVLNTLNGTFMQREQWRQWNP